MSLDINRASLRHDGLSHDDSALLFDPEDDEAAAGGGDDDDANDEDEDEVDGFDDDDGLDLRGADADLNPSLVMEARSKDI